MKNKHIILFFLALATFIHSKAQQVEIKFGNDTITENDFFTISIIVNNGKLNTYSNFPEISGFIKYTTVSNANNADGKIIKPLIITQQYSPLKAGKFKINDFSMNINGRIIPKKGTNIFVKKIDNPIQEKNTENQAKNNNEISFTDENINLKEPFLILNHSKSTVFVREGFNVALLFCIPEGSKTSLKFYELGAQLTELIKKIKPENCAQEAISIDSIQQGITMHNGKRINYFKLYETSFYPINNKKIEFAALTLNMMNKKNSGKDENDKSNLITYNSKPFTIEVKNLPPHPLKDIVPVGNYKLIEAISTTKFKTGKSFNYVFTITGEGNMNQISKPRWQSSPYFEIFEPEVIKTYKKENNKIIGSCSFNYYVIPHEPGNFGLKNYFNYIYFNTFKEKYDTLHTNLIIQVHGDSKRNMGVALNDGDQLYELMQNESNFFVNKSTKEVYLLLAKGFVLILIILLAVLIIRR